MRDMGRKFCGFKWSRATEEEIRRHVQELIHSKIKKNNNDCWEWQGCLSKWGYGDIRIGPVGNKKHVNAHRAAWLYFKRDIPESLFVCHKCDNRKCCNPDHLFLGTAKQNQHDMIRKGRKDVLRGDRCPWSKLNEKKVIEILEFLKKGKNCSEIGRQFGVDRRQISDIKRGRRWKHVGDRAGIRKIKGSGVILNKEKVEDIKVKLKDGARISDICKQYDVARATIYDIKKNKTWKHVSIKE